MDIIEMRRRRLRQLIKLAKTNVNRLARAAGVSEATLRQFLDSDHTQQLTLKSYDRLAAALALPVSVVIGDQPLPIKIIGECLAGDKIRRFDLDASREFVAPPPGLGADAAAVTVDGDSMEPAYRKGDTLYFDWRDEVPPDAYNRDCVIELETDVLLLKTLLRGSRPGHYTLVSYNRATIDADVRVVRAAPIVWIHRP